MLSIVIPHHRDETALASLLNDCERLRETLEPDIVISDSAPESSAELRALAQSHQANLLNVAQGRGAQIRAGVEAVQGGWIWIVHADSHLADELVTAVVRTTHQEKAASFAWYADLRFDSNDWRARLVAFGVRLRCAFFALPYGDQSLLIHSDLLGAIGGVPDLPLMEDVHLARSLGRRRLRSLSAPITTSARRYQQDGWMRRSLKNLLLLGRFLFGASPDDLAKAYRPKGKAT